MKPTLNLAQIDKRKLTLLSLGLGLAFGFTGGQMLHSEAQSSPKVESSKTDPETQVRVHTGSTRGPQRFSDLDEAINKLRASASRLSLPSNMFEPWWKTMQHDPDASWMLRNFDVMSSDMDRSWVFPIGMGAYIPRLDTTEQGNEIKITAEVPGIDDKDLDVTVNDDSVTIKGDKKDEVTQSKADKSFHAIERSYGAFERTISLPCKVQSENAQAILKNGVLTITVPKSQLAQTEGKKLTIRRE
ncbi:MAG: Hsp20/alpha crystallin family protein [Candidatus Obscuribacterales bacterium]|nr:Hsp20/alpha crystallin family protein [Candidatus Obscuribacterales bacterium]